MDPPRSALVLQALLRLPFSKTQLMGNHAITQRTLGLGLGL